MKKTKRETINELREKLSNISELYKLKCVNWTGKTIDTDEYFSEIIANELLNKNNRNIFKNVSIVTRGKTYCKENHKKMEINLESNRKEEIFAKRITGLNLGKLGIIKDYQIPLKRKGADKGLGKIDLLSYNKRTHTMYLIELKFGDNKDTLLKASLETYTYFRIVDKKKLIKDCLKGQNNNFDPLKIDIKPAVMVVPFCNAYKELNEMENGKRDKLKSLILALGIKFFNFELFLNNKVL